MEWLLLLLLSSMQQGGDPNAALRSFLAFYRENRDLLRLLARQPSAPPEGERPDDEKKPGEHSPGLPDLTILEEYLRRSASHAQPQTDASTCSRNTSRSP